MDKVRKRYRTIVLSDIHMGSKYSKTEEVCDFLSSNDCERLILNGDTIDGWQLQKLDYGTWGPVHSRFFRIILKMIDRKNTCVYMLRGNHDDFLDKIIPMQMGPLNILKDLVIETGGQQYFVTHGDVFDSITSEMRWMARLGDFFYNLLLKINVLYNRWQSVRGRPYYSFSQEIKNKVKKAVAKTSDFDRMLTDMARKKGCQGVICGHIHRPEDRMIDGIRYLNSGDWVETLSALVEDFDGRWSIIYYRNNESGAGPSDCHVEPPAPSPDCHAEPVISSSNCHVETSDTVKK